MRRIALLLLAVALATLVAGCGTVAQEETQVAEVSAAQVAQRFKQAAGRPLERAPVADVAFDQLGYGLDQPKSLVDRYGIFNVYVGKEGRAEAIASLLKDKATGKPLERDGSGIYWELDSQSDTWVAYKRYQGNVVLVWFSGSTLKAADARFERLDSILIGLPG
ncbi:MAG: hypothetical protein ABI649_02130 [Gaiellaceae bacterium]